MALEPDSLLENRYRIVRAIKSGGMGAVYEARDGRLNDSPCAVKEMLEFEESEATTFIRAKFEEEKRVLATLNIPGVPRVRDFFLIDRTSYIVMDLVEGHNLEQELIDHYKIHRSTFSPLQVVNSVLPVLEILANLHNRKPPLVHRDVKPANLVRDGEEGRVWLVDFGLVASYTGVARTQVGTLGYAPWEQHEGSAEPRSDLYAVGATMFHLLVGQPPPPLQCPSLKEKRSDLDEKFVAIVDKATAQRLEDRWQSAEEFSGALRAWLSDQEGPDLETAAPSVAQAAIPLPRPVLAKTVAELPTPSTPFPWTKATLIALAMALPVGFGLGKISRRAHTPPPDIKSSPFWGTPELELDWKGHWRGGEGGCCIWVPEEWTATPPRKDKTDELEFHLISKDKKARIDRVLRKTDSWDTLEWSKDWPAPQPQMVAYHPDPGKGFAYADFKAFTGLRERSFKNMGDSVLTTTLETDAPDLLPLPKLREVAEKFQLPLPPTQNSPFWDTAVLPPLSPGTPVALPNQMGSFQLPEGWRLHDESTDAKARPICVINAIGKPGVHIRWTLDQQRGVNPQAWADDWIESRKVDKREKRSFVAVAVHPGGTNGFTYVDLKEEGGQSALAQQGFLWLEEGDGPKRLITVLLETNDPLDWPVPRLRQIAERAPFR